MKPALRPIPLIAGFLSLLSWTGGTLTAAEAEPAPAKSSLRQFMERDYLLGDWWGARTALAKHGVDFEFLYFGAVPTSLAGGLKEGSVYEGTLLMTLDLDSEKLAGYQGGHFHASSLWIHNGQAFSPNYIGDLNQVSMLDFPDSFRLWELYYEQKFFQRKLTLKAGQLDIGRDFIVPEYYTSLASVNFLNQTFWFPTMCFNVYDQKGFPQGYHGLASTPYGAPGLYLRFDPLPQFYAQAGVYDGNPDRSFSGTRVNLNSEEGALSYFELGYRLNQTKEAQGPPGNFKLGAYYHTDDFVDCYDAALGLAFGSGAERWHSGNYGGYFLADQMIWREIGKTDPAQQGLAGFARVGLAPADRNLAQLGLDGGLAYRGLIPTRDWDTVSLAVSYLQMSDDIRQAQRTINDFVGPGTVPIADYETVLELGYRAQLTAWWSVQASAQRVFHPGGRLRADIPDSWVLIIGSMLRF